jgi:hypothetical protein
MVAEGECSITANQSGSANYLPAPSITKVISLSKGTQTIDFTPTPTLQLNSFPNSLQATSTSDSSVTFISNSPNVCTVNSTIQVYFTRNNEFLSVSPLTLIGLGLCSITVNQLGNATFNPALEVTKVINVVKNIQSLAITNTGTGVLRAKSPLTVSATSFYGFDLSFINNSENICTLGSPKRTDGLSPSFKVESPVTMVREGVCSITARVSGNQFYDSAEVTRNFSAYLTSQRIVFSLPATLTTANFPYNLPATSDSGLPVSYEITPHELGTPCSLSGGSLIMVSTGYCIVTAFQPGDGLYSFTPGITRVATLSKSAAIINIITPGLAAQQRGTPWVVETSDSVINLEATSSSGTQPYGVTWSPGCTFTGLTLNIVGGGGLCQFNIYAAAGGLWNDGVSRALEIYIRKI